MGVPRVWEKIYEKMMAVGATSGLIKRFISGWAKQQSLNHYCDQMNGYTLLFMNITFMMHYFFEKKIKLFQFFTEMKVNRMDIRLLSG